MRLNIFTSKVSNLQLPLETEGPGAIESYPTSEIPNKYIYYAFLMIYLSFLVLLLLLFFVTFWHFKRVNQRFTKAVIPQFCKIVREISR